MGIACCSESPELQIPCPVSHWAGSGAKFALGLQKSSLEGGTGQEHSKVGTWQGQHGPFSSMGRSGSSRSTSDSSLEELAVTL